MARSQPSARPSTHANVNGLSYTTPVKNQASCGSCVAFGTVATVETTAGFTRGQPQLKLDLSEQHLFFVLGAATGASCANGWWPEHAFTAFRDTGVTFEDYMPYQPGGGGALNGDWPNRLAKVTGFQTLTGNVAAIKNHIATRGAVSACLVVYQDFFSYGGGVYRHVSGAQAGGHCISLVGFDEPLPQTRRQQQLLLTITRDEVLRHPGIVLNPPDGALCNSLRALR